MKLRYVMLEINGQCSGGCTSCGMCLPHGYRSNRMMTKDEIATLRSTLKDLGVEYVTFAGYGNPADHPDFAATLFDYNQDFETTVTCRVQDVKKCGYPYIGGINVSVQTIEEIKQIIHLENVPRFAKLRPHIVVTEDIFTRLSTMLWVLGAWHERWEKVSIAVPVALCDDVGHRKAIREANRIRNQISSLVYTTLDDMPKDVADKFSFTDYGSRKGVCQWPGRGVLINANMDVLPCCNLPCVEPMGNLKIQSLKEIVSGEPHGEYAEYCERCPDLGT